MHAIIPDPRVSGGKYTVSTKSFDVAGELSDTAEHSTTFAAREGCAFNRFQR